MELLYVLIGGALVVCGYFLAKYERKEPVEPEPVYTPQIITQETSDTPIDKQLAAMQAYDPKAAAKKGNLEE
jgi:hypothetical protein